MREHHTAAITWFQFESFAPLGNLVTHGVFARLGGVSPAPYDSLNTGLSSGDSREAVRENRARVVAALPDHPALVTTHPVHGARVVEITPATPATEREGALVVDAKADAMITRMPGRGLFWGYADCTPVLLVDPRHEAIGLAHAGWRGTSEGVAPATIAAMTERYGTDPADLWVGLAPGIGPCCYEVDSPVRAAFDAHPLAGPNAVFASVVVPDGAGGERHSTRLDVAASNVAQLRAVGVPADHIETSGVCTGCRRDLFFSHRRENGRTGRFAVVVALR